MQISLAEALPLDIPSMLTEDNYDFAVVNVQDLYTEYFATNKNLVCTSLFEEKMIVKEIPLLFLFNNVTPNSFSKEVIALFKH